MKLCNQVEVSLFLIFLKKIGNSFCGAMRGRTANLLRARQALSQLSYSPKMIDVGLGGLEPPTSRLSGVRSNHLSYRPIYEKSLVI